MWFTTSKALRLSNVTRNKVLQEFIFASALASETRRALIIGESPLVKPNWRDDCSSDCSNRGSKTLSNSFPIIGVTVIPQKLSIFVGSLDFFNTGATTPVLNALGTGLSQMIWLKVSVISLINEFPAYFKCSAVKPNSPGGFFVFSWEIDCFTSEFVIGSNIAAFSSQYSVISSWRVLHSSEKAESYFSFFGTERSWKYWAKLFLCWSGEDISWPSTIRLLAWLLEPPLFLRISL